LLVPAAVGAGLALAVVLMLGVWLHRPLATMPENAIKFGVGIMLAAFGTFWIGEGIGLHWPGEDIAIVYLIAVFLANALVMVATARRIHRAVSGHQQSRVAAPAPAPASRGGPLVAAASELWGLFVEDGWLAGGILVCALGAWAFEARYHVASAGGCAVFASGVLLLFALSVIHRACQKVLAV
jgi:hypothetical protein